MPPTTGLLCFFVFKKKTFKVYNSLKQKYVKGNKKWERQNTKAVI